MNREWCGMEEGVTRERPCPSYVQACSSAPFLTVPMVSVQQMKVYHTPLFPSLCMCGVNSRGDRVQCAGTGAVGLR